ncbi:MAG: hypothetical protein JW801_06105 [Bacteroidales bacterium]|nr:hypothetical protein [Bacteroidales bacterium]
MIKKTSIALLLLLVTCAVFSQGKHVGIWKGTSDGEVGFFKFDADGYATITTDGETMGGKDFIVEDTHVKLTYTIDYSLAPHHIDFVLTTLDDAEEFGRFIGIIEFLSKDEMKIRIDFNNEGRPTDFLPEGNEDTVILHRVSKME